MSKDGFDDTDANPRSNFGQMDSVEYLLFDSLVYSLIEKGVLTKNDALGVIETVAHVVRGYLEDDEMAHKASAALATLDRTYSSFQAMAERASNRAPDGENVRLLRPPLHADRPRFPRDD